MEYNKPFGYCLTRNVKDPEYGTEKAGCLDFFVPEFDDEFIAAFIKKNPRVTQSQIETMRNEKIISLSNGEDICIPSGVHVKLEPNTALTAFNKSGIATRLKLIRGAEYVDCDYTGEIHLHVINVGTEDVSIEEGMKIIQFSYVPVFHAQMRAYSSKEELYSGFDSARGEGWQGSTGLK